MRDWGIGGLQQLLAAGSSLLVTLRKQAEHKRLVQLSHRVTNGEDTTTTTTTWKGKEVLMSCCQEAVDKR